MPTEQCYGVIVVYRGEENLFLILQNADEKSLWGFPKGHQESGETPKETALRELKEETGVTNLEFLDFPLIREEYTIVRNGEKRLKINDYFLGYTKDKSVVIEEKEISDYKWATFEQAIQSFNYETKKDKLKKAKEYLDMVK